MAYFRARVILYSKQMAEVEGRDYDSLETWDDELTPLGDNRPVREWARAHLEDWNRDEFADRFALINDGPFEILFEADISGHWDAFNDEWDEDVDIKVFKTQPLPAEYFASLFEEDE